MASPGTPARSGDSLFKTITCPVMDRPELFDRMLASLARNDLEGWHLFVTVEPSDQQDAFAPICARHLPEGSYSLTINPRRLGIRANLYQVMRRAFEAGSDLNIYLEEDFLLAPDVTALADWYFANRKPHWLCLNFLAGSCGNPGYMSHVAHPEMFFETDCFNSQGFVMEPDGWARIRDAWLGPDLRVARRYPLAELARTGRRHMFCEGWDWAVFGAVLKDSDLKVVQPVAARSIHIGAEGYFCRPDYQEQAFGHITLSDALPDPAGYRIVDVPELPDLVRGHVEALQYAASLTADIDSPDYPLKWPPMRWIGALKTRIYGHPLDPKPRRGSKGG